MKIFALLLVLFTPLALAQIQGPTASGDTLCDMTFTLKVQYGGEPAAESTIVYHGFTSNDSILMHKSGQTILGVADKNRDKARPPSYSVEFGEQGCGASGNYTVDGVTLQGLGQIMRQASKVGLDLIKTGEDAGAKGKRKAWGNK
jgi:hypothetical protein